MFSWLIHQFNTRLLWQISIPLITLFILSGAIGIYLIYFYVQAEVKRDIYKQGEFISHSMQYAIESSSHISAIQRYIASVGADESFDIIVLVAGTPAKVIAANRLELIGAPLQNIGRSLANQALTSRTPQSILTLGESPTLEHSTPILISNIFKNSRPIGEGALMFRISTKDTVANLNHALLIASSIYLTLLVVLLLLCHRFIFAPQKRLLHTISERKKGNKSLVHVKGNNELANMGTTFNEMLEELDKVDTLKNEFISTVSHELRTPLTSIRGSISLILGTCRNKLDDNTLNLIDIAARNSEQLIMLVNDILDIEKIHSGKLEYHNVYIDLVSLCRKAIEVNEGYAHKHGITLVFESQCPTAMIHADAHRILQVFANLLSNAVKFSPQNSEVKLILKENGPYFRSLVKDHGRGIPESFHDKIFQRFSQADSSDSREKGGTGLGLNICKSIIEHHSGHIGFTSKECKGTEFFFDLPKTTSPTTKHVNKELDTTPL